MEADGAHGDGECYYTVIIDVRVTGRQGETGSAYDHRRNACGRPYSIAKPSILDLEFAVPLRKSAYIK